MWCVEYISKTTLSTGYTKKNTKIIQHRTSTKKLRDIHSFTFNSQIRFQIVPH